MKSITKNRIFGDIKLLNEDPSENINVFCFDDNILEYKFLLHSLDGDYTGGEYMGRIVLDSDYPKTPPEFYMTTPNGRFEPEKKICLNISKFHKMDWNPLWTIIGIMKGFESMFVEDKDEGISHIKYTPEMRQKLAKDSIKWNKEYSKKTGNDLYNILKTQYFGHGAKSKKIDKDGCEVKEPKLKKIKKESLYKKLDEISKTDKDFAKILKNFKKNMEL